MSASYPDSEGMEVMEPEIIDYVFSNMFKDVEKKETEHQEKKQNKPPKNTNDDEWSDLELLSLQDLQDRPPSPGTIGL